MLENIGRDIARWIKGLFITVVVLAVIVTVLGCLILAGVL